VHHAPPNVITHDATLPTDPLEPIATGAPIKAAATVAGYSSPSAFVAAFRKAFGTSPSRHLRQGP
jgi:AraC-like DNA-binding protein